MGRRNQVCIGVILTSLIIMSHHLCSAIRLLALYAGVTASLGGEPQSAEPSIKLTVLPLPREAPAPPDNATTPEKVLLGRLLFFDPILSASRDVACATCHHPSLGWADGRPTPIGMNGKGIGKERTRLMGDSFPIIQRNVPTILNVGFNGMTSNGKYDPLIAPMFWDARATTLEAQALVPIRAAEEMRGDLCAETTAVNDAVKRVRNIGDYRSLFAQAFGGADAVTASHLAMALAAFERSLVTADSPFDRFARGSSAALTALQKHGLESFQSAGCALCHNGPMLSDYRLHFIGTPGQKELRDFRTPTLRNLKHTAPYMHNGSLVTLRDVLLFYDRLMDATSETLDGGDAAGHPALDPLLKKLNVNPDEFPAIEAFLDALSDDSYDQSVPGRVPSGLPVPGSP